MCTPDLGSVLLQGSGNKGCEKFILRFDFIAAVKKARQESLFCQLWFASPETLSGFCTLFNTP